MSKTLYRKYRPHKFSHVLGQDHIVQTLQNAILSNRIAHAYIFTGPRGTGKTTVARLFATAINTTKRKDFTPVAKDVAERLTNGTSMDIIEIDAASSTSVEGIRTLKETVNVTPSEAAYKVYIIDEVHMLSTSAFNALLKTLEEPPEHVIFILATTEIHKVPETILSRCQRFDFARFTIDIITEKLRMIAQNENVTISDDAYEMIAIASDGGMRDAESLLAQVLALEDKNVTASEVARILGTSGTHTVINILDAYVNADVEKSLQIINETMRGGYNLETFIKTTIEKLRIILFLTLNTHTKDSVHNLLSIPQSEITTLTNSAQKITTHDAIFMIEECTIALQKTRSATITQLPLEIASITICARNSKNTPKPLDTSTKKPQKKEEEEKKEKKNEVPQSHDISTKKVSKKITPSTPISETTEEQWKKCIIEIEKEHKPIGQLLSLCTLCDLTDSQITIATERTFYQEKILESTNREIIERSCTKIFGTHMKITVTITKKEEKSSELLNYATQLMGGVITES